MALKMHLINLEGEGLPPPPPPPPPPPLDPTQFKGGGRYNNTFHRESYVAGWGLCMFSPVAVLKVHGDTHTGSSSVAENLGVSPFKITLPTTTKRSDNSTKENVHQTYALGSLAWPASFLGKSLVKCNSASCSADSG